MGKEDLTGVGHHESMTSLSDAEPISAKAQSSSLIERALKPTSYTPRYPKWMVGKPLLWATCFFGSLGDALFGYDQGMVVTPMERSLQLKFIFKGIMSGLLVNEVFIKRFYSDHGGSDGTTTAVNPSLIGELRYSHFFESDWPNVNTGITVSCLQLSAAIGALLAGYLGDIMGRKRCVRIGGFIYFAMAFLQSFAPNLACFIAGRTIQGLGVGFLSMTVPVIQTEIAAPHRVCPLIF
jgi:MFS family permease